MKPASLREKELYATSNPHYLHLYFSNGDTFSNDEIYQESMSINEILCDASNIKFGSCNASEFRIKIYNVPESHLGQEVVVALTIASFEDPSETYQQILGRYTVVSDELTDDKMYRELKAYDKMYDLSNTDVSDWYVSLWENRDSMTLKEFRDSLFRYLDVNQLNARLVNDDMIIEETVSPSSLSAKEVISCICEINACFGRINSEGKFQYLTMLVPNENLYPSDDLYPNDNLYPREAKSE